MDGRRPAQASGERQSEAAGHGPSGALLDKVGTANLFDCPKRPLLAAPPALIHGHAGRQLLPDFALRIIEFKFVALNFCLKFLSDLEHPE